MKFNPPLTTTEAETLFQGKFSNFRSLPGGEGGQGIVFKATQVSTGSSNGAVAVKIYYPGSLVERTAREVAALQRLKCEMLVNLVEAGYILVRGQQCMCVVTEFIEGSGLFDVLKRGRLPVKAVARIAYDIALALDLIWGERIVHRDVKPQNIMLAAKGHAVLIDLGVGRHLSMTPLTTLGKTWGTEGYMSPEQAQALRNLSCKSDVFALGVVLQEALLGAHPTGYNQLALNGGGRSTATLGLNLPGDITGLIDSMLLPGAHLRPTPFLVAKEFAKHL